MKSKPPRVSDPFVFTLAIKPQPDLLREIREMIKFAFGVWGLDDSVPVLLANEMATNAMTAAPNAHGIEVRTYIGDQGMPIIEVRDESPEMPAIKDASESDESGRGMVLIDHLSSRWGASPEVDGGKVVWAEMVPEPA